MVKLDTSIDRLVEFIRLKKSTTVDEAARALSLQQKQVEEIAEVLAESGLIHLKYEFSGIRLTPQLLQKDANAAASGAAKPKKAAERLLEIKAELDSVEGMVDFSQKDVDRRMEAILAHFKETENANMEQENLEELKKRIDELIAKIKQLQDKVAASQKKSEAVATEMKRFEDAVEDHRVKTGGRGLMRLLKRLFRRKPKPAAPSAPDGKP